MLILYFQENRITLQAKSALWHRCARCSAASVATHTRHVLSPTVFALHRGRPTAQGQMFARRLVSWSSDKHRKKKIKKRRAAPPHNCLLLAWGQLIYAAEDNKPLQTKQGGLSSDSWLRISMLVGVWWGAGGLWGLGYQTQSAGAWVKPLRSKWGVQAATAADDLWHCWLCERSSVEGCLTPPPHPPQGRRPLLLKVYSHLFVTVLRVGKHDYLYSTASMN